MPRRILRSKKKTWPTAKKYNICAWIKRPKINRKAQRKRTELRINRVWPLFFPSKYHLIQYVNQPLPFAISTTVSKGHRQRHYFISKHSICPLSLSTISSLPSTIIFLHMPLVFFLGISSSPVFLSTQYKKLSSAAKKSLSPSITALVVTPPATLTEKNCPKHIRRNKLITSHISCG